MGIENDDNTGGTVRFTISDTQLLPIRRDKSWETLPLDTATVEAAIEAINKTERPEDYLGFSFAQAAALEIMIDGVPQKIALKNGPRSSLRYIFASKVVSYDEFRNEPEYKADYDNMMRRCSLPYDTVIYETPGGLNYMTPTQVKETILITKSGQQLWRAPAA